MKQLQTDAISYGGPYRNAEDKRTLQQEIDRGPVVNVLRIVL